MASLVRIVYEGRPVWVKAPDGPDQPVLMSFHGKGGTGKKQATRFKDHLDLPIGFIFPDGGHNAQGGEWSNPKYASMGDPMEDVLSMDSLIDAVLGLWGSDPDRVFCGGFSAGGHFAAHLLVTRPDLYAGFHILAALPNDETMALPGAMDPLPSGSRVYISGGLSDSNSGWDGSPKPGHITVPQLVDWGKVKTGNASAADPAVIVEPGVSPFVANRQVWPNEWLEVNKIAGLAHAWAKQSSHGIDSAGLILMRMGIPLS